MIIKEKLVVAFDYEGMYCDCLINRERDMDIMEEGWTAVDIYDDGSGNMPFRFDIYGDLINGEPSTENLEVWWCDYKSFKKVKSKIEILECE